MKFPILKPLALASFALALAASMAVADEGMWLFNNPPSKLLKDRYGFEASAEWLDHVQKSCARFSTGGSGSIVSAEGLVMTNHHVGADMLAKLSTPERDLLKTGFLAATRAEEARCPDLELDVLWTIEDVTDRVNAAAQGLATAEAGAARRKAMAEIESAAKDATGLHTEVVTLYQGGRYHLYSYKRYTDVRLVLAPEKQAAFYGGDNDNFEYPRYDLDCCFFRIYENDAPLATEHFLRWSANGSAEGDLVFVTGHPGSTQRLYTVAHLEYLRDVRNPVLLNRLWRAEVKLQGFSGRSRENARIAEDDLFGVANSRKAYTGTQAGLLDPALFAEKRAAEERLRAAVAANPEWQAQWGDAWSQVARAEAVATDLYRRYSAIGGGGLGLGSELLGIAGHAVRLAEELPKPSGTRLREYGDAQLESLYLRLYSPAPIYPELEVMRLESALSYMAEQLGAGDVVVEAVLRGKSPRALAEECVLGSKLIDVEARKRLIEGGKAAVDASKEPLVALAKALDPHSRALRKRWEDEVQSAEREAYAKIAAAKFAVEGEGVYPDATFTLRLAFGTVKGYEEGGRRIPAYTTIAGKYEKARERQGEGAYELPESWVKAEGAVAKSTPYNFVSTCDIIGGNSGSPVVNRAGEVVGLIFDGNIQSLIAGIAYTEEQGRAVSVDSRAILEAMRSVYGAGIVAEEISKGMVAR
jgi:hypothetical protein